MEEPFNYMDILKSTIMALTMEASAIMNMITEDISHDRLISNSDSAIEEAYC